jgi:hypothetical protein
MFKGILVVDNITYSQISLYCSNIKLLLILLIVNNRQKVILLNTETVFNWNIPILLSSTDCWGRGYVCYFSNFEDNIHISTKMCLLKLFLT